MLTTCVGDIVFAPMIKRRTAIMERRRVKVGDYEVMTYSEGTGDRVLLVLHGGPGVPCDYVRDAHLAYAQKGYRVVSWDQLGCGESDQPNDASLWNVPRYVDEVEAVRATLDLGQVLLLGHSWGGTLGLEYCLAYPQNVKAFVAVTIAFDQPLLQQGYIRIKQNLGAETIRMLALRETEGSTDHPEYQAAMTILNYRHTCRVEKWPDPVVKSMRTIGRGPWRTMFGPHSFNCTGNLRNYNRNDHLHRLKAPVLILASEHDYILPEYVNMSAQYIPDSKCIIFRNCAHMPFWEDPDTYHRTVSAFLESIH
jgi:proline iminopeptidase